MIPKNKIDKIKRIKKRFPLAKNEELDINEYWEPRIVKDRKHKHICIDEITSNIIGSAEQIEKTWNKYKLTCNSFRLKKDLIEISNQLKYISEKFELLSKILK